MVTSLHFGALLFMTVTFFNQMFEKNRGPLERIEALYPYTRVNI